MNENEKTLPTVRIESLIHNIRGKKVILDSSLANLYGVTTKRFNEQIKRNIERFPDDFMFILTEQEFDNLRSQIATSSLHGGRRYSPKVFTEHGALMAANVLNSSRAIEMSVFIVRAFVKMRETFIQNKQITSLLTDLEKKLSSRLDNHENAILHILQEMKKLTTSSEPLTIPENKIKMGFVKT